jgi:hypothetical protein
MYKKWPLRKTIVILVRLLFQHEFSRQIFMKIRPVGAEMIHADRWTDRHDEANSGFSQFDECASERMVCLNGRVSLQTAYPAFRPAVCLTRLPLYSGPVGLEVGSDPDVVWPRGRRGRSLPGSRS